MQQPLISVIVPVYHVEAYLPACLDSLLAQTYQNLEIIAVDDGSPDRCGAILDEYAKKDARIRVIHQQNMGVSAARNAALAVASGACLGFLDADDTAEPTLFETLYNAQQTNGTKLSAAGFFIDWGNGTKTELPAADVPCCLSPDAALSALISGAPFGNFMWNKLFARELFEGLTFPVGSYFEEIPLMYRLFERAGRVSVVPDCLVNYLQRAGSTIGQKKLKNELDYCMHALARCYDLSARKPQFSDLLLYCLFTPVVRHAAMVGAQNPLAAHRAEAARKHELAVFLRANRDRLCAMLGMTDRMLLRLLCMESLAADYAAGYLVAMARLLEKLHLLTPRPVPDALFPKEEV